MTINEIILLAYCLFAGITIGLGISISAFGIEKEGYKKGQIDALRGIVKYELKRNEDGEEVWTKIEEK